MDESSQTRGQSSQVTASSCIGSVGLSHAKPLFVARSRRLRGLTRLAPWGVYPS